MKKGGFYVRVFTVLDFWTWSGKDESLPYHLNVSCSARCSARLHWVRRLDSRLQVENLQYVLRWDYGIYCSVDVNMHFTFFSRISQRFPLKCSKDRPK